MRLFPAGSRVGAHGDYLGKANVRNDPRFLLNEELSALAFRVHPYHHDVIGDMADLQTMTSEDLFAHYRRCYAPTNAIIVAVGDFVTSQMLGEITAAFAGIPAGTAVPPITRQEPAQKGERRATLYGSGDTTYLTVAFRAPAATDPGLSAPGAAQRCVCRRQRIGLFGGGGSNVSSRLYKALVQRISPPLSMAA
jgi:zinc protease